MGKGQELGLLAWEYWGQYGVPVFPCGPDKRPLCKWRSKASTDKDEILALFARADNAVTHIGAAMGEKSKLFAIDFDVYKGPEAKEFAEILRASEALPETRIHNTQSGGAHYVYRVPKGHKSPRNSVPYENVEVRGEGGYILVPPTGDYEVVSENTVDAPEALLRRLSEADAAFKGLPVAGLVEKIIAGEVFHEALTMIAAKMHGAGAEPSDVMRTMVQAMEGSVASNPKHKRHSRWLAIMEGDDGELARISQSAYKKFNPKRSEVGSTGITSYEGQQEITKISAGLFSKSQEQQEDQREEVADEGAFPFSRGYFAGEVDEQETAKFLIYPLVQEQDVIVLSAEPKAGKTMISTTLALHAASGFPIGVGDIVPIDGEGELRQIPVVYFALESQGAIRKRIQAWLKHHDLNLTQDELRLFVVEEPAHLANAEARQRITDKLVLANNYFVRKGWGPMGLVVFDTLTKTMPGKDQNSVEDTSAVFQITEALRAAGSKAAIMFVHHDNRSGKGPRGSGNILAEPDTLLSVTKLKPKQVGDKVYPFVGLSVYMARSIDDRMRYAFQINDVQLGKNAQGIMDSAPVLELMPDYEDKQTATEAAVKDILASEKIAFYSWLFKVLSNMADMEMSAMRLTRNVRQASAGAQGHFTRIAGIAGEGNEIWNSICNITNYADMSLMNGWKLVNDDGLIRLIRN